MATPQPTQSAEKRVILDSSGYESDLENTTPLRGVTSTSLFSGPPRNRRRRDRTQFTAADLTKLEEYFLLDRYPDIHARERLAEELAVSEDRIQVWFQNRRSKLRRRAANRPPPLNLPKHIMSTHAPHTPCAGTTPISTTAAINATPAATPEQLAAMATWGFTLLNGFTPLTAVTTPSPISVLGMLNQPVTSPEATSEPIKKEPESKPQFKRPWETPSPSERSYKRTRRDYDPLFSTVSPLVTPDLLCRTPGIPATPSTSGLFAFTSAPFIPYSPLGHPGNGYMFYNSTKPTLMDSYL